jgi:Flp pilus assembly pilin Flp
MQLFKRLLTEEEGQDIVEYALMIGLVVVVIWVAVKASGVDSSVSTIWSKVESALNTSGG